MGFGLVEKIEEVEDLIKLVDFDGSGEIEFDEFLKLLEHKPKN